RRTAVASERPPPKIQGARWSVGSVERFLGRARSLLRPVPRRDPGDRGGVGLGQEHAVADGDAPAGTDRGHGGVRWARHHPHAGKATASASAGRTDGVPEPVLVAEPTSDGRGRDRNRPAGPGGEKHQEDPPQGAGTPRTGRPGGPALQPFSARVLRRTAAADRERTGTDPDNEVEQMSRDSIGDWRVNTGPGVV